MPSSICLTVTLGLLLGIGPIGGAAWTQEALDLYDLIEEVNDNFFDVLGVPEDATSAQIRKAFRTKSLEVHPDKNEAADAADKFRQLVDISNVLKSPELKEMYMDVLRNGLPDWKQPVYYFRATAKLSLRGLAILLMGVTSVMHYAALWGTYLERRWAFNEAMASARKRQSKRTDKKKRDDEDAVLPDPATFGVMTPSLYGLWWVQLGRYLVRLPAKLKAARLQAEQLAEVEAAEHAAALAAAEKNAKRNELAEKNRTEHKEARRKRELKEAQQAAEERKRDAARVEAAAKLAKERLGVKSEPKLRTGPWSEDERSQLARAMNRHPGGTINRWEVIAVELNRSVKEVMAQAHTTKQVFQTPTRATTRPATGANAAQPEKNPGFSQIQQTQLEEALRTVPKDAQNRWDAIADKVDGKTKAECIARIKELRQMVQNRQPKTQ